MSPNPMSDVPLPMTPQRSLRSSHALPHPKDIPLPETPRRSGRGPTYCVPLLQTPDDDLDRPYAKEEEKRLTKKAPHIGARIVPEQVPKVIDVQDKQKDEKSVVSNLTMPKALRPSRNHKTKKATPQEALFAQVLKEEQEKARTMKVPKADAEKAYESATFSNMLGLDPNPPTNLVKVDKDQESLCDSTLSGSDPPQKANVFRRFQGQFVAGIHLASTKLAKSSSMEERPEKDSRFFVPSTPSPRPSPRRSSAHSKSSPELTTPTRAKKPFLLDRILPSPRISNNASFLPRHLTFNRSEDDEDGSFLADLTTQAVGSVLSAALDIPEDEETRNDCRSESQADPEPRDEGSPVQNDTEQYHTVDLKENSGCKNLQTVQPEETAPPNTGSEHDESFHGIHVINVPVRKHAGASVTDPAPKRFANPSVASEVDEEAAVPQDDRDDDVPSNDTTPIYKRVWFWILMVLVAACVVGGVTGLLFGLALKDDKSAGAAAATGEETENGSISLVPSTVPTSHPTLVPSASPTLAPTLSPTARPTNPDIIVTTPPVPSSSPVSTPAPTKPKNFADIILDSSPETKLAFLNPISPQSRALGWLEEHTVELTNEEVIQRFALATIFYSLNEAQGGWNRDDFWLSHADSECSWFGVSCNNFEQVSIVNLNFNNLGGTLPKELSLLSNLRVLSLGGGTGDAVTRSSVTGTIPTSWGDFTNLETLELFDNMLSGAIPETFGQLTRLKTLRLYRNNLSSNLPTVLGNMKDLEITEMSSNKFSGELPTELGSCTLLTTLALARNRFHGSLPTEIGKLTSLTELHLNGNNLSGVLPNELWGLSSLSWIAMYNNYFRGALPSEIGQLKSIEGIQFHGNQFEGSIPLELSQLDELRVLDLSNNQLTGSVVPTELQSLNKLAGLYLHENDLDGEVSQVICDLMDSELRQLWTDCSSKVTCPCCTKCF